MRKLGAWMGRGLAWLFSGPTAEAWVLAYPGMYPLLALDTEWRLAEEARREAADGAFD